MVVREIEGRDIEAVRNIYSKYYADSATGTIEHENVEYFTDIVARFVKNTPESTQENVYMLVAENDAGKVVGIIGSRRLSPRLHSLALSANPVELDTLFVLEKRKGVGRELVTNMVQVLKDRHYTELIVRSAPRFKDDWGFYDVLGFTRVGMWKNKNGHLSQVWSKHL